ncbi:hypothetical protein L249_5068 [Ophiocordyceps polyrhachis-furcata BCC 54312]|uniref:Uncharacterized protein n=1 Tax=Ophiocordyceps polyrhachis-furcata BCC 54312 TaxID=1330021 RepID=A0A367L3S2_9HYPO|nr:hypothetical protein L249_5068 [Ophiocordyceps polyrhachis-furcata BCC 54312]
MRHLVILDEGEMRVSRGQYGDLATNGLSSVKPSANAQFQSKSHRHGLPTGLTSAAGILITFFSSFLSVCRPSLHLSISIEPGFSEAKIATERSHETQSPRQAGGRERRRKTKA